MRPGEKLHEELISENDSLNTLETKDYYITLPKNSKAYAYYKNRIKAKPVKSGFSYKSNTNKYFLKVSDLREI